MTSSKSFCPQILAIKCIGEAGRNYWSKPCAPFSAHPPAPPERIVHPAARSLDLQFGAPGHVELRCEVAPAGSQVRWYKDGLEVEVSDALQLGAEGPARTLTLPHAQPEDAGEYVCETRDEAVTFNVSLAGGCAGHSLGWGGRGWLGLPTPFSLCRASGAVSGSRGIPKPALRGSWGARGAEL